jgi:hypothetical protein
MLPFASRSIGVIDVNGFLLESPNEVFVSLYSIRCSPTKQGERRGSARQVPVTQVDASIDLRYRAG